MPSLQERIRTGIDSMFAESAKPQYTLLYDGFISEQDTDYIRWMSKDSEYNFWVECDPVPQMYPWSNTALPKYKGTYEDCMGNDIPKESVCYGIVAHKFVGFRTAEEKQIFIDAFPENVVNEDPFRVSF